MATSPQTQHQPTSSGPSPANLLESRPFEAIAPDTQDTAPSTFQSRPFSSPADPSIGSLEAPVQPEEHQRTDSLFDFTQVNLFAGAAPSDPPPTVPTIQRSESSESGQEQMEGDRPDESEHPIQRKGGAFASGDDGEDKPGEAIQAKLTIGQGGDRYEQEADQVAANVVSMPDAAVQRQENTSVGNSDPGLIDGIGDLTPPNVQAKDGAGTASADFEQRLQTMKGKGAPLGDDVRSLMEPRFGADFSQVRVHTDATSIQLNKDAGAQAFTHGNDVYFNAGKYSPDSKTGKELLAHELTHTIQQTGGKLQRKPNKSSHVQFKRIQRRVEKPDESESVDSNTQNQDATQPASEGTGRAIEAIASPHENPNAGQAQGQTNQSGGGQSAPGKSSSAAPGQTAEPTSGEPTSDQAAAHQPESNPSESSQADPTKTDAGAGADASSDGAGTPGSGAEGAGSSETVSEDGSGPPAESSAVTDGGETAPQSAEADPDFQAAVTRTKQAAMAEKHHAPATAKSQEAQAAAVSPPAEIAGQAQANQVDEMQQAETPGFNKAAFKAKLMEKIKAAAPKNLKEADDFKNNNTLGAVKGEMTSQVKDEKAVSQQPLEQKTKEAPDTSGIEPKPVTPLPQAEVGAPVASVGAEAAVPKPKGQSEVEQPLQHETQRMDQEMADADISEEQLATSNEPEFQSALAAKQDANANASEAPNAYRQAEQGELSQAEADAGTMAQQKLQGMHGDRAQILAQVAGQQVTAKGQDEQARSKVATDIQGIYDATKSKVETILGGLDSKVNTAFDSGAAQSQKAFEDHVGKKMDAYKSDRYSGVIGKGRWVKDKFMGLPSEVNVFYTEGRTLYLEKMDGVINQVVDIIATELNRAKTEVANGRQKVQAYVAKLPQDLQKVGQDAATSIQSQFDSLEQSVDAKQDELIDSLAQKYNEKLKAVDARITEMKAANKGLVDKAIGAIKGVVTTIKKLKNMLLSVLKGAASAIKGIIKDPIGFLGNLISGIKQGFDNFVGNIWEHLQGGLIGWLTGAMGSVGIQIPEDIFSLPGIFDLVMQILGMSWNYVRTKAVKLMGEPVVAAAEKAYDVFLLLQEKGPLGLWEHVQDQFTDLKETVIGEIKNMVITQVITAGVKWILGLLNPASAFVKACMLIYDIVMFFVNQGSQVLSLMKAVIDGVKAIASGSIGAVAKAIEGALVKSLPVVIGFLASLLGIGGLTGKVKKIITKIRGRIDKAIDKILLKAKKLFKSKKTKTGKKEDKSEVEKKHASIGKTAANELKKLPSKDVPYEKIREMKEKEARTLEKKYNKQLEKPVRMSITFKSPQEDLKDGDMDFHIYIGPNDFNMDSAVEGVAGSHEPEVGTYGELKPKSGAKDQEAHHVPPKGLLKWIVGQADAVINDMSDEDLDSGQYDWIVQLAELSNNPTLYDPGNPLAAISINKHTHIKKTGDINKDAYRAHWGKGTAKEVLKRLDGKGLRLIYRTKFNQLSIQDREKYQKLLAEAGENMNIGNQQELEDYEDKTGSVLSTQFFSTELNAALRQEEQERGKELNEFKINLGNVAKGAYSQAHEAVTVALEKSDKDGPKDKRSAALNSLKSISKSTWNSQPGIRHINMF